MTTVLFAIASIAIALIGALTKLALSDRDRRIKELEDQNAKQEVVLVRMHGDISVLQYQTTNQLHAFQRLEGKIDQLWEG